MLDAKNEKGLALSRFSEKSIMYKWEVSNIRPED